MIEAGNFSTNTSGIIAVSKAPVNIDSNLHFLDVSCGSFHTVALTNRNEVWCVGKNRNSELGIGYTSNAVTIPTKVVFIEKLSRVICGNHTTFFISVNKMRLYGTGMNSSGQLGLGNANKIKVPQCIKLNGCDRKWQLAHLSSGGYHTVFCVVNVLFESQKELHKMIRRRVFSDLYIYNIINS